MKATYDARTDTLSIILNADAAVAESDEDKPGVILDYDQDGNLVSQVRPLGGGDKLVDRLSDQRFQPCVLIGPAIGRENAIVLAQGRLRFGRLRGLRQARLRYAEASEIGATRK